MIPAFQHRALIPLYNKPPKDRKRQEKKKVSEMTWLLIHGGDIGVRLPNLIYKLFGFGFFAGMLVLCYKTKSVLWKKS